ncbi:RNA polymerase sigma factor [Microbulbifer thermotolerans]|nr:RNA polymerase sigma factor [Microbulbifer thermotolerans]MCX2778245.1 RNA polymerase sigma factor [Microbulbifer thermotolerans]MCX2795579.1 RNA polymerase sigma factor [Microbulbifer thermotolerans]MCX2804284.1 RNA polymerase sigma factor [Microbulbifer thermotolerans]SFC36460.1 RNA polymerase sigma-70 factor, ECF subfamily [Microbulbifer thermotolerans]
MSIWLARIFERCRSPEERFVALVSPHIRRMYRMAFRWTMNAAEAEDLVQDVLISLLPKVAQIEKVERLGPWLIKVLYRRFVDLYRSRQASPIDETVCVEGDEFFAPTDCDNYRRLELRRALNRALRSLDGPWRDIVLLHDVEGYSAIEVADILEINIGTVKSRLHRARKKLKKILAEETFSVSHACQEAER